MNSGKRLLSELCQVVTSFLCQPGVTIDISSCRVGQHIFSKGVTQPICTVKLEHGHIYNVEFVYRYWYHILRSQKYPLSPVFIISNNGLTVTLKCFVCEPRDIYSQFGNCQNIDFDVYLPKNSNVILSQDDFLKFKTNLVFSKDLNVYNSMVVCRTYLTENRQALQFLVVKPNNPKRVSAILHAIRSVVGMSIHNIGDTYTPHENCDVITEELVNNVMSRKPIRTAHKEPHSDSSDGQKPHPIDKQDSLNTASTSIWCGLKYNLITVSTLVKGLIGAVFVLIVIQLFVM
ncbi:ORF67 [Felid gammaherpesvirus 1]|uniref:ORF67 n=1 Tax=Felid gammaherpesvirus 1 TaxID=2560468 RepID=A0A0M3T970_9GAMA|nr:ORF67 [Felis catus gammaherpesvirus 1]ALE14782.1 ORF67 [Felis catus gammaherpesvirus 1]